MNEKQKKRQEEYEESIRHYYDNGMLKEGYVIGCFEPSWYDDMVTNGRASIDDREARKHHRQMTPEEREKSENDEAKFLVIFFIGIPVGILFLLWLLSFSA